MATRYSFHHQRQHHYVKRLKRVIQLLSLVLLIAAVWLGLSLLQPQGETAPSVSKERDQTRQPTTEVFSTPYFEFEVDQQWTADPSNSSQNGMYIYRAYRGSLIQQDLTIYVNVSDRSNDITRVQPVAIQSDGSFSVNQTISEHCSKGLPAGTKNPTPVTYQSVSFTCLADGTIYSVLVGEINNDGKLVLPRPGGSSASYTIVYRDLSAMPDGRDLGNIVRTFKTR